MYEERYNRAFPDVKVKAKADEFKDDEPVIKRALKMLREKAK
jgi:hypothetical protein